MFAGAVILAAAEFAGIAAIEFAAVAPAQAQFFGGFSDRPRPPPRQGGLFDGLFGRPSGRTIIESEPSMPVDSSRAPPPRKPDARADAVEPTTSIVVMGDGMADWLASGLEEAFADAPEIGIVRKNKTHSGLLRYDARNDLDWWHVARDILGQEKPKYVIMMLGVSDRQNIRERDLAKEAEKKKDQKDKASQKEPSDKTDADKSAENAEQPTIVAPEPRPIRNPNGIVEFRSEQWEKVYARRIDETVVALKSKGVPVFWVGLPSIRGIKSTADVVYLNDLYRARAEKAGAVYIDVWDGFVDEGGKYTNYGPDYEGQVRRLRSGDGVYFTRFGARKLAHYVEREVRRYMSNRGPIALPSGPMGPVPADGKSAVRPLAGPVVPLTQTTANTDELLGGSGTAASRGDAVATGVLVKGDAVAAPSGRADDFGWPRGSVANAAPTAQAAAPANAIAKPEPAPAQPEPVIAKPEPEPAKSAPAAAIANKPAAPASEPARKPAQNVVAQPRPQRPVETRPQAQQNAPPRPPQPLRPPSSGPFGPNGPFGWMR